MNFLERNAKKIIANINSDYSAEVIKRKIVSASYIVLFLPIIKIAEFIRKNE